MMTLIIGENSNLSRQLAATLTNVKLLSARKVAAKSSLTFPGDQPFRVIINSFQPATKLRDVSDPVTYVQLGIGVTARVLAALPGTQCQKVIYTSSASVYGDGVARREESPLNVTGLQPGLKLANEKLVQGFCEAQNLDFTITRLFNMYGGEDEFSFVAKVIACAREGTTLTVNNEGSAVRDFIHVRDVVTIYLTLLGLRDLPVINVASGLGVSIRSIVDAIQHHGRTLSVTSHPRQEIRVSTADVSRLASVVDVAKFTRVTDYVLSKVG